MPACLVPHKKGPPLVLDKAIILIGRGQDCDVTLPHSRKISRHHCCVAQVDDNYVIRDLGSMNGIRVNGVRAREARLGNGDEVAIGDLVFTFECREKAVPAPPRPAAPLARPAPQRPRVVLIQPPDPSNLSQEIPVAIPDPVPRDGFSRETPQKMPPLNFDPDPDDGLLKLDSGEIELKKPGS